MTDDGEADNPFRPGSELSREADIIVNLIKEGKPITPTRDMVDAAEHSSNGLSATATKSADLHSSPNRGGHNSSSSPAKTPMAPGVVEVQHGIIVPPGDKTGGGGGVQVEQVTLKKKRKCCTIQ